MTDAERTEQDESDFRTMLEGVALDSLGGRAAREVIAQRLAAVLPLMTRVAELEARCSRCGFGHKACMCMRRVEALEQANAGEPKRVVFEAAHSILERISKLEAQNEAFQSALMQKSTEADEQDRRDATYNAAIGRCPLVRDEADFGKVPELSQYTKAMQLAHEIATEQVRLAHGPKTFAEVEEFARVTHGGLRPEDFPQGRKGWADSPLLRGIASAAMSGDLHMHDPQAKQYVPSGLNSVPSAVDEYFAACSKLADKALALLEAQACFGPGDYASDSDVDQLRVALSVFRYDSPNPVQPNAVCEWRTFKEIVCALATGDLASGPDWMMALRDRAKAAVGGR